MKEQVLKTLADLGFVTEQRGDHGYSFDYEECHLIYIATQDDDDEFLNIVAPHITDLNEMNELDFYKVIAFATQHLQYVKAYPYHDCLWLGYERQVRPGEDLEDILPRMIVSLERAIQFTHTLKARLEAGMNIDLTASDDNDDDK